jgi:hypothetical protein
MTRPGLWLKETISALTGVIPAKIISRACSTGMRLSGLLWLNLFIIAYSIVSTFDFVNISEFNNRPGI